MRERWSSGAVVIRLDANVSRDVKRIAVTGGLMIAILAVLHILVNVMGVITL